MDFIKKPITIIFIFGIILLAYKYEKGNHVTTKTVTELVSPDIQYPHPYSLMHVAQYRFAEQVCELLVRRDGNQNIVGGLASSWTINPDRKSIIFRLRDNALYNATEVVQSLKRLHRAHQTSHSNLATQVASENDIIVLDQKNVQIRTIGDAGAIISPLIVADTAILPDDHWIDIPGLKGSQVDWSKVRGPYIHVSGSFQNFKNEPIIFKPNPNHYMYNESQVKWKMVYRPEEKTLNFADLKKLLEGEPSFTTLKYWELSKVSWTDTIGLKYYETKPNGVNFLIPNTRTQRFSSVESRLALFKHLINADLPILNKKQRAYQMIEPGLPGRMLDEEINEVLNKIKSSPDIGISTPVKWAIPNDLRADGNWVKNLAESIGLPYQYVEGPYYNYSQLWVNGDHDILVALVGLGDSDPISGATFLFSPTAGGLDYPDGRILKLLNSVKGSIDKTVITEAVHKAFRMALEGGLMLPLNYVTNRYYYSNGVELNIQDPYSENVLIWDIRIKN